jgi:TonB family protein
MILPQVVPADTTPVMLAVGPEMEPTISLWHGAYTCQVAVLNEEEIKESFGRAVQALRRQNAIRSRAHGRVVIQYVVGTTGVLDRVTVTSSSGWAEADSAAVRALRVGEFLPQVQGKYAVPAAVQTPFNF